MTGKILGSFFVGILVATLAFQVISVNAKEKDRPVTGPITSPITAPTCKPGWGFGDKNHCHEGPPGQVDKEPQHGNGHH